MTAGLALTISLLLGTCIAAQRMPARDTMPSAVDGTAVIAGVVVTAGPTPTPMRRVTVTLSGPTAWGKRTIVTDDTGRFQFDRLPAGRYLLSAYKPAFLVAQHRTTASGTATADTEIALTEGQQVTDVVVTLVRGGVLTGRITDERGQPHSGTVAVQVWREEVVNGERRLTRASGSSVRVHVDERGVYRVYGLEPGDYLVSATARYAPSGARVMTPAEIDRAIRALRRPPYQPAAAAPRPPVAPPAAGPTAQILGDLTIYYPGTEDAATATRVALAAGEERGGIDFRVWPGSTVAIRGRIIDPSGPLPSNLELRLFNVGQTTASPLVPVNALVPRRPGPNGEFTFTGVAPGRYVVTATTAGPAGGGGTGGATGWWAKADVSVFNTDLSDVVLTLRPGVTVSGQVVMAGAPGREPSPARVRVSLSPAPGSIGVPTNYVTADTDASGRFTVAGVVPARYTFRVSPSARLDAGWILRSAIVNGRDIADLGLEIEPGRDVGKIAATLSDRPAEISGVLQDASGRPTSEYVLVLFPADKTLWPSGTRRIQRARPATDGRYVLRNVLAGEYLLAAVTAVDPATLIDPQFLEALVPAATPVTVSEGERKTQDVRVASGGSAPR